MISDDTNFFSISLNKPDKFQQKHVVGYVRWNLLAKCLIVNDTEDDTVNQNNMSKEEDQRTIELISSDDEVDQISSPHKVKPRTIPHSTSRDKGNMPAHISNAVSLKPGNKNKGKQSTLDASGGVESDRLKSALKKVFKFEKFRSSLQEEACKAVLEGQSDVFVCMPTGAGL
jgi:superfamily II RNA helicase